MKLKYIITFVFLICATDVFASSPFWQKCSLQVKGYVNSLATDSRGNVYASTPREGIFISSDRGATWSLMPNTVYDNNIISITVDGNDSIYACTERGMFINDGRGGIWQNISGVYLFDEPVYSLCVTGNGKAFAGSWMGLYQGQITSLHYWDKVTDIKICQNLMFTKFRDMDIEYVYSGTFGDGVFRYDPVADKWTRLREVTDIDPLFVYAIATDSTSGYIIFSTNKGMKRVIFNKKRNDAINKGLENETIRSLAVDKKGTYYAGSWTGGVYISSDQGQSWTKNNEGLQSSGVYSFTIDKSGYVYASCEDGVYRSVETQVP